MFQRNRNVIISDCQIYNNSGIGVYFDRVNLHQVNITGNHINRVVGLDPFDHLNHIARMAVGGIDDHDVHARTLQQLELSMRGIG